MAASSAPSEKTYFEQQREALVGEIAISLENVLQSINKLNRSFEGVIAVGNEFSSVEALWSQFENVMAREEEGTKTDELDGNDVDETQAQQHATSGGSNGRR